MTRRAIAARDWGEARGCAGTLLRLLRARQAGLDRLQPPAPAADSGRSTPGTQAT
jgi:hypothetical protein